MATIKELIEEKAKRYDEAKEKAKVLKECSTNTEVVRYMDELFPELAESEDGRIRNYILSHLQQHLKTVREFSSKGMVAPFSSEEIKMLEASVVWLEKQGEQESIVVIPKFRVGDVIRPKGSTSEYTIESISGECYRGDLWRLPISCDNDYELVGQKPTEWSVEDERKCNNIIALIEGKTIMRNDIKGLIRWLKSLRPQSHWKPSENELEVLRLVAEKDGTCLMGLYENLKKLKEA